MSFDKQLSRAGTLLENRRLDPQTVEGARNFLTAQEALDTAKHAWDRYLEKGVRGALFWESRFQTLLWSFLGGYTLGFAAFRHHEGISAIRIWSQAARTNYMKVGGAAVTAIRFGLGLALGAVFLAANEWRLRTRDLKVPALKPPRSPLIAEAQDEIRKKIADPSYTPDIGGFKLRTEVGTKDRPAWQQWDRLQQGEMWDLIQNERTFTIRAPIYQDVYIHYAYLDTEGAEIPVPLDRIRLAQPNTLEAATGWHPPHETDSEIRYPGSFGYYRTGPIPEESFQRNPYTESPAVRAARAAKGEEGPEPTLIEGIYSLEELKGKEQDQGLYYFFTHLLGRRSNILNYSTSSDGKMIVFKDGARAEREFLKSLPVEERRGFLVQLAVEATLEVLGKSDIDYLLKLLEQPQSVGRESWPNRIDAAILTLAQLLETSSLVFHHFGDQSFNEFKQRVLHGYPRFEEIFEAIHQFNDGIQSHPVSSIAQLNLLTPSRRRRYLDLIRAIGGGFAFDRWESDFPGRFPLSPVERALEEAALDAPLIPRGQDPHSNPEGITYETLIDLILTLGPGIDSRITRRWDEDVSDRFWDVRNEDDDQLFARSFYRWPLETITGGKPADKIKFWYKLDRTSDRNEYYVVPRNTNERFLLILHALYGRPQHESPIVRLESGTGESENPYRLISPE